MPSGAHKERSMKEMPENALVGVVEKTRSLLKTNPEWPARYADYANKIQGSIPFISASRSSFRESSPLKVYLNITSAKGARRSVSFELRYLGQTVAELKGNKNKGFRLSTKRYRTTNRRDFDCDIWLPSADWRGEDSATFRSFFKARKGPRLGDSNRANEEHRLESLLLTEFSRRKSKEKPLLGIQPVRIAGVRSPIPTPISASNPRAIKYSGTRGGGIDILARTGTGGRAMHLCILELKIKGGRRESASAMEQAVAYTTFVRELLRSESGAAWWRLFGFGGDVPESLELYSACAMPLDAHNETSFGRRELNIEGDTIRLHYLYFVDEGTRIRIRPGDTTLNIA